MARTTDTFRAFAKGPNGIVVLLVEALLAVTFGLRGGTRRARPPA